MTRTVTSAAVGSGGLRTSLLPGPTHGRLPGSRSQLCPHRSFPEASRPAPPAWPPAAHRILEHPLRSERKPRAQEARIPRSPDLKSGNRRSVFCLNGLPSSGHFRQQDHAPCGPSESGHFREQDGLGAPSSSLWLPAEWGAALGRRGGEGQPPGGSEAPHGGLWARGRGLP